jgi:hypothetical protein
MLDSIGTLGGDSAVQLVAGVTGAASLAAFGFASLAGPPRPCWTRNRCMLKREDVSACQRCTVYARAHFRDLHLQQLPELGEIRRLTVLGSTAD